MTKPYDLPIADQLELVEFARARLAEERKHLLRGITAREEVLDKAAEALRALQEEGRELPSDLRDRSVGDNWPGFMTELVAAPYRDHPDYKEKWGR